MNDNRDQTGRTTGGRDRDERGQDDRGRAGDRDAVDRRPPQTSAGSTGQAGQSSTDTPGFSETGRRHDGRQGPTDPSRDWPGPDETGNQEAKDAE
jgi:hypothetical protein